MQKGTFHISKMDCPSEEALVRMKLEGLSAIKSLVFDIENRKLTVFHSEESPEIENHLKRTQFRVATPGNNCCPSG